MALQHSCLREHALLPVIRPSVCHSSASISRVEWLLIPSDILIWSLLVRVRHTQLHIKWSWSISTRIVSKRDVQDNWIVWQRRAGMKPHEGATPSTWHLQELSDQVKHQHNMKVQLKLQGSPHWPGWSEMLARHKHHRCGCSPSVRHQFPFSCFTAGHDRLHPVWLRAARKDFNKAGHASFCCCWWRFEERFSALLHSCASSSCSGFSRKRPSKQTNTGIV